jgi:hypothetical protein
MGLLDAFQLGEALRLPSLHADLFLGRSGASDNAAPSRIRSHECPLWHLPNVGDGSVAGPPGSDRLVQNLSFAAADLSADGHLYPDPARSGPLPTTGFALPADHQPMFI